MLGALLLALQVGTALPPADISIHATVEARSVKVEKKGEATIRAWAEPDGGSTTRSSGTGTSGRFELRLDARIAPNAGPQPAPTKPEATASDPPR